MAKGSARSPKNRELAQERLAALQEISIELMSSRDLKELLAQIVNKAVDLLETDAGTLYLGRDQIHMTFEVAVNRSMKIDFERHSVSVQKKGLASYVFKEGKPLIIEDVYAVGPESPYSFDETFDKLTGYRTKSVMIQPLKSSKGTVLGVLQLINRKKSRHESWPSDDLAGIKAMPNFTDEDAAFLQSFTAVASAAIENAKLYKDIENLFENFVKASVSAIEARDFSTRGHSERVAALTVDLAEKVSLSQDVEIRNIRYNESQINEIRYASLLHDFGKIGVKESVLLKEEKLSPLQKIQIRSRLDDFRHSTEIQVLRNYLQSLFKQNRPPAELDMARIEKEIKTFGVRIEEHWNMILEINKPTILDQEKSEALDEMSRLKCQTCNGHHTAILEPDEVFSLSIKRGSLTETERLEIESHVTHTYRFLKQIPWTRELARVPEIAYAHHERMNGRGYPERITGDHIPDQARIMAICDIFDALVAADRPYKKSVPIEKALEILESEAKGGGIDPRFLKVFIEARIYENSEFRRLKASELKAA